MAKNFKPATVWTAGLAEDDKAKFHDLLKASHHVLERLADILEGEIETSRKEMAKEINYDSAHWHCKVADMLGSERARRKLQELLRVYK